MAKAMMKVVAAAVLALGLSSAAAYAQACGNTADGFETWKSQFRQ